MNRCPKDEPTAKNLVCRKGFPNLEKNWENILGGSIPPPLDIGGLKSWHEIGKPGGKLKNL